MPLWETEKQRRDREARESGIWATIFLFVIFIVPVILAKILGFFVGIFLKLGIVGKVVLTVFFSLFVLITLSVIGGATGIITFSERPTLAGEILELVILTVFLAASVFLGIFWFWRKHYHTLKNMSLSEFSELVKICFAICFYGSIGLMIILAVTNNEHLAGLAFGVPFLCAIVYWLLKTKNYQSIEPAGQTHMAVIGDPDESMRWAKWPGDGSLYFANITGTSGNSLNVRYYDGNEEELNESDVFSLQQAIDSGLSPHGNWQGEGSFYPCNILKMGNNSILVKYSEDGVEENMPYERLVFVKN